MSFKEDTKDFYVLDVLNTEILSLIKGLEQIATKQRGDELTSRINRFEKFIGELPTFIETDEFEVFHNRITQWVDRAQSMLDDIDAALRELRRQTNVGAQTAP